MFTTEGSGNSQLLSSFTTGDKMKNTIAKKRNKYRYEQICKKVVRLHFRRARITDEKRIAYATTEIKKSMNELAGMDLTDFKGTILL